MHRLTESIFDWTSHYLNGGHEVISRKKCCRLVSVLKT